MTDPSGDVDAASDDGAEEAAYPRATTRQALRASYLLEKAEEEKRTEFFVYVIFRPLSFLITPLFLRARFTANAVSVLGMVLAVTMPLSVLVTPDRAFLWLAAVTFCLLVLDCVDGNIARTTGSASRLGRYVDSFAGKSYQLLVQLSLGFVAVHEVPDVDRVYWVSLALAGSFFCLWARESRTYSKLYLFEGDELFATGPFGLKHVVPSIRDLLPFGLLMLGPFSGVYLILIALSLLCLADFGYSQLTIFRHARR